MYGPDMVALPSPSSFQLLPWRGTSQGTARMFCDIRAPDGSRRMPIPGSC